MQDVEGRPWSPYTPQMVPVNLVPESGRPANFEVWSMDAPSNSFKMFLSTIDGDGRKRPSQDIALARTSQRVHILLPSSRTLAQSTREVHSPESQPALPDMVNKKLTSFTHWGVINLYASAREATYHALSIGTALGVPLRQYISPQPLSICLPGVFTAQLSSSSIHHKRLDSYPQLPWFLVGVLSRFSTTRHRC